MPPSAHLSPAGEVVTLTPSLPSVPFVPFVPLMPSLPAGPVGPEGPVAPGAPGAPSWPFWFQEISVSLSVQWDIRFVDGNDLSISRIVPVPLSMQAL